jgi:hypothetical protein
LRKGRNAFFAEAFSTVTLLLRQPAIINPKTSITGKKFRFILAVSGAKVVVCYSPAIGLFNFFFTINSGGKKYHSIFLSTDL